MAHAGTKIGLEVLTRPRSFMNGGRGQGSGVSQPDARTPDKSCLIRGRAHRDDDQAKMVCRGRVERVGGEK